MWRSERKEWMALLEREREKHRAEIELLLERIQRPEHRPATPGEIVEREVPRDSAEMAHIGGIVPEFVNVGSSPEEDNNGT